MLESLKVKLLSRLLGGRPPKRAVKVRESDTFIVSYPRSGNTMVRFMISVLIEANISNMSQVEKLVPDIYFSTASFINQMTSPRILKSHEHFDPQYRKVIYIVRDPRDVCVSYYHYLINHNSLLRNVSFQEFVDMFVYKELDTWGNWKKHVLSWHENAPVESSILVRFEDILYDKIAFASSLCGFLNLDVSSERLLSAAQLTNIQHLQEIERASKSTWSGGIHSLGKSPFFRSGKASGWRGSQYASDLNAITQEWKDTLQLFGYE